MSFNFLSSMPFPRRKRDASFRIEPAFDARQGAGTFPRPDMPDVPKLLAAARKAPQLTLLEWDGEGEAMEPANESIPGAPDRHAMHRRIRDRYIGARFPGVAHCAAELAQAARVVKAARLYFEEEDLESALELLQLAVEEAPQEASLWLARLEILFLARDGRAFVECAREFRSHHPEHEAWAEVVRLGRALLPNESLFGGAAGKRDHEHYGPWPDLPNWIQAPWDLTAEILAADFHRAMQRALTTRRIVPPLAA